MVGFSAILLVPHPWSDALFIMAVAASVILALFQLEIVWLVWLVVLPVAHLSSDLFQIHGLIVLRILTAGLSVVALFKSRDSQILRALVRSNGFRFFGLYVLANILSALYVFQTQPLFSALTYTEPLLFFAVSYYVVCLYRDSVPKIVWAVLIGGTVLALVGFYEMATQQSVAAFLNSNLNSTRDIYMYQDISNRFGLGGRISSLIGQPVVASLYFAFLSLLGVYFFKTSGRARWLAGLFGAACAFLLLATGTRGGVVALVAGGIVLVAFGLRRWKQRIGVLALVSAALLVLLLVLPNLGTYLVRSADVSAGTVESRNITGRIALTRAMLGFFQQHWLLGYGPGRFQKQAAAGVIPTVEGIRSLAGIENQYATILVDGGIVAGLAYLLFMSGVGWDIVRMMRQPRGRRMGVTLFALFAAYFVYAATETSIITIPNLLLMALYGAFAAKFEFAND